jgi:hypothetical protein
MPHSSASPRLHFLAPVALLTALGVLLLTAAITLLFGGVLFSPGALNAQPGPALLGGVATHADLQDCAACHAAPWSGQRMSGLCLNCHTDLKDDPKNFHNVMIAQGQASACSACHTEHHGANAALIKVDLQGFPHAAMGFSLQKHAKMADGSAFACTDCHAGGYARFDAAVCSDCHALLKAGFMPRHSAAFGANCLACHDGLDTYGANFDHQQAAFPLAGKHNTLDCADCHTQAGSIAALKAAPQACQACHAQDDAHQGSMGADCAKCHTPQGWQEAKIDHATTRFPLLGQHASAACTACHINGVFKGTPLTCAGCHAKDDAHQGRLGADCAQCHTPTGWTPATINHILTGFALTGKHLAVDCTACHANRVFKGTPATCVGCHADPAYHKGLFSLNCNSCHSTTAWTPATFNQPHTFPINHERAGNSCHNCHTTTLAAYTCYTCHEQRQMARQHTNQAGTDISNCVRCHPSGDKDGAGGRDR